ncbi:MAG: carbohydrate deacetylase, partial [Planctomycetota bacterium]
EFDAQIRWALDHGLAPTHLDSHRHAHGLPAIFKRVIRLARRYDIAFVRRYREVLPGRDWPAAEPKQRRIAKWLTRFGRLHSFSAKGRLLTTGTLGIAHTGSIDAAWLIRAAERLPDGVTEIMTHPGLADDLPAGQTRLGDARPGELAALCDPRVREAFERAGVRPIHYGHRFTAQPL